ncbi:WXG100 family type VII secretion target [Streptosporangium sp. CA-115845]|uniref:WXG100 family type VII secretion target n=1 Tax=Streptosporangium sp. CA-115845 TaxID=3240071 RepID=UPI003D90D31A
MTDRDGPRDPLAPTVPGSADLIDIVVKVNGDQDSIKAIATRWRSTAGTLNERVGELNRAVGLVNAAWQGASADAFATYMRKYHEAGEALRQTLTNSAKALDTAAEALGTAESKVNAIAEGLVTRWNTYRAENPGKTETELAAGIKPSVDQAINEALAHLDSAGKAVTQAVSDLRKHIGERAITFAGIPAPSEGSFVPKPGHVFDWQQTPLSDQRGTTLSGASGGSGSGGSGGYASGGTSSAGNVPAPKQEIVEWIKEALTIIRSDEMAGIMRKRGIDVSDLDPNDPQDIERIWTIIHHESGGNPSAINNWDINARNGVPSQGLMQTIPPTFNAHSLPGHGKILEPVDNIIAGVLYTYSRYGSLAGHPGIASLERGGGYKPY